MIEVLSRELDRPRPWMAPSADVNESSADAPRTDRVQVGVARDRLILVATLQEVAHEARGGPRDTVPRHANFRQAVLPVRSRVLVVASIATDPDREATEAVGDVRRSLDPLDGHALGDLVRLIVGGVDELERIGRHGERDHVAFDRHAPRLAGRHGRVMAGIEVEETDGSAEHTRVVDVDEGL